VWEVWEVLGDLDVMNPKSPNSHQETPISYLLSPNSHLPSPLKPKA
jgi:hypothetical protein